MKLNVEFQEADSKKKIKRIMAREGLVLLGIALIAIILAITEPLAIGFDYPFYFFPLCIAYAIIRLIWGCIRKFNLKISWFDKSGILVTIICLLSLYFEKKVSYITEPYPKTIQAILTIVFLYTCVFALVLLIRFIIWALRTLRKEK